MIRSTRIEGRALPSSTWFRKARLKSVPVILARLRPRSLRIRRMRWPSVSLSSTAATLGESNALQIVPRVKTAGQGREVVEAMAGDDAGVLDANAAQTKQVQAGFH